MAEKNIKRKNWVFTWNNYTEEDERKLQTMECKWLLYGHEIAPTTGTPHLQGCFVLNNPRWRNGLKAELEGISYLAEMKSIEDSDKYCKKEGDYFEKGEKPEPKNKNLLTAQEWDGYVAAAKEGKFDEIPSKYWVRYQNSFKQIYSDAKKDPDQSSFTDYDLKHHFLWLYGPTGTGKSHSARRIAKELGCPDPYLKDLNKWWNGYDHQKVTIIEEANPKKCEFLADYFKKWLDKWSFTAECKGTVMQACRPEYIIVTSNYTIRDCFPEERDYEPLERRCTEVCLNTRAKEVQWPETGAARGLGLEPSHSGNISSGSEDSSAAQVRTDSEDDVEEPPAKLRRTGAMTFNL